MEAGGGGERGEGLGGQLCSRLTRPVPRLEAAQGCVQTLTQPASRRRGSRGGRIGFSFPRTGQSPRWRPEEQSAPRAQASENQPGPKQGAGLTHDLPPLRCWLRNCPALIATAGWTSPASHGKERSCVLSSRALGLSSPVLDLGALVSGRGGGQETVLLSDRTGGGSQGTARSSPAAALHLGGRPKPLEAG